MTSGMKFGDTTISAEYTDTLVEAVTSTYGFSSSTTVNVSCGDHGGEQIGLWQWVTATSDKVMRA